MKPRIPSAPLRPIVQNYLDRYETTEQVGNPFGWISPVTVLAAEADVPERHLRHLLAGTYDTIEFDRADRLLCAMGLGTLGWMQNDELWDSYCHCNLALYEPAPEPEPPQQKVCESCEALFVPGRSTQRFCCTSCRTKAGHRRELKRYQRKPCRYCTTEYQPYRKDSRYCSIKCMNRGKYHLEGGAEQQKEYKRRRANAL